MDKILEKLDTEEKIKEFNIYVHNHFKLISTVMLSELRTRWDIEPTSLDYKSLLFSIWGRMFNEMTYLMVTLLETNGISVDKMLPENTIELLKNILNGKKSVLIDEAKKEALNSHNDWKKWYVANRDKIWELKEKEKLPHWFHL